MAYANANADVWNPMAESYYNANINSYEYGPGRNLTPSARSTGNSEYKLYVSNIPPELNETGILQLFSRYSQRLQVFSPPGSSWAFVTFRSFREAEAAMRGLNNAPPLYLTVTFAKKKPDNSQKPITRYGVPNIETVPEPPLALDNQRREYVRPEQCQLITPTARSLGRGRELVLLARRTIAPPPPMPVYRSDELLYPNMNDPNIYNPYEDAEPFASTNTMWIREKIQLSSNGTRFVTNGRGYTRYELPATHPKVNDQIRAVYEIRKVGLYEYGVNKFSQQVGECENCMQRSNTRCLNCGVFYCSRLCQEIDWPRHKVECQPKPRSKGGSGNLSISSGDEVALEHERMTGTTRGPLRRPMITAGVIATPSTPMITLPDSGTSAVQDKCKRVYSGDQKRDSDSKKSANTGGWNPTKSEGDNSTFILHKNRGKKPSLKKNSQSDKRENKGVEDINEPNGNPSGSVERIQDQSSHNQQNRNYLPRGGHRGNSEEKNDPQVQEKFENLNINDKESVKSIDEARRMETSVPERARISEPDLNFVKASGKPKISGVQPPSKMYVSKSSNDDAVAGPSGVESATKSPDHITGKTSVISPPKAETEMKNIVDLFDDEKEGYFETHVLLGGNKAAATVCSLKIEAEYLKITNDLTLNCDKLPSIPNFKPSIGDLVCGKRLDDWIRGTVTSLGPPIRLAAIDEGRVEAVTAVRPVPCGFEDLPTLGAVFELTEGNFELQSMEQYAFKVEKCNPESVSQDGLRIVLLLGNGKEGKGFLKPWTPAPEQKGMPYATLTSGTEVCITSFRSHALLFARSLLPKDVEIFNRITQDVAKWSTTARPLTSVPILGEIVIAKYEGDGNFYRAIVTKIVADKITITYIDFGDTETTTLKNIRSISSNLKEYHCSVAKIFLKDVPRDVPMTKEVSDYLAELTAEPKTLLCTFGNSPTDGVVLKVIGDGTCVNNKINELLTPSWKKEKDEMTVFTLEDMEVAALGPVGQTINVLALYSYDALMHCMAPWDEDLIDHVTVVMAAQMQRHCKETKEHYIPRQNELCLALFEGQWFRAVCVETNATPTASSVNYIDFGNIANVDHTNIKMITKDFITAKMLASLCSVVGLGPVDENGDLPEPVANRVKELVVPNSPVIVKIVECLGPGEYTIELPEVRDVLVKEGLLKV